MRRFSDMAGEGDKLLLLLFTRFNESEWHRWQPPEAPPTEPMVPIVPPPGAMQPMES